MYPRRVKGKDNELLNCHVITATAGGNSSGAITIQGHMYMWGANSVIPYFNFFLISYSLLFFVCPCLTIICPIFFVFC